MLVEILLSLSVGVSTMGVSSTSVSNADDYVCYFNNSSPYRYFFTKTLYEDVYHKQPPQKQALPGCQPSLLYLLVRHGSRFPSDDDIILMDTLLPALRDQIVQAFNEGSTKLCAEDVDRLKTWRLRFSVANASELAAVGYQEMVSIARRFQTRFPELLKKDHSEAELRVRSTYKDRTIDSAKGFLEGLFNRTDINPVFLPKGEERILRFKDSCKRYEDELDDIPIPELQRFINSPVYETMVRTVEARLGLPQGNLSKEALFIMSRMCMFDHVLYSDAPWCAAFSESDLRLVEDSEDLDSYYSQSYGAPKLAIDMSCEMMKDFFQHLRNGGSSSYSGPRAILRFAHSREVQTFMSALGLYEGDPALTADNMAAETHRKWRTSLIAPFAANVGFSIYLCEGGREAKIQAFVNEKPIILPGCSQNTCELSKVFKDSKRVAETCNFDAICANVIGGSAMVLSTTSVFASLLIKLFVA